LEHSVRFGGLLPPDGILSVQNSLCVQVLRSHILAALLHGTAGTPAAGLSQTLRRGTTYKEWNYGTFAEVATYIPLGGHHVGHQPIF